MPLLTCPIDGTPMQQIVRHGIELDVSKNGVWLDKGELEKLMQMIREAAIEEAAAMQPARPAPVQQQVQPQVVYQQQPPQVVVQQVPRGRDWDDDDYKKKQYYGDNKYGYGYKKKSKMSNLLDIFDF